MNGGEPLKSVRDSPEVEFLDNDERYQIDFIKYCWWRRRVRLPQQMEFFSPAFIEAVLKAYRMTETGVTTPRGKIITDEQGKPIRLEAGEGFAQAAGFRPERLARISGEHWTMENVQKHFKEKKDDLYSRYRLARTPEEKQIAIRDMQRFNFDAKKNRGVVPPITATSMGQAAEQKPEKPFIGFGRMMEVNP